MSVYRGVVKVGKALVSAFYEVEIRGGKLPAGPVLVVANHPNSVVDPVLVAAVAGRPLSFLAKAPLLRSKFLGPVLRTCHAVPAYRRQDGDDTSRNADTFDAVRDAFAAGQAVAVFPEGVSREGSGLEPLRTGAARMVLAADVDVMVVAVGLFYENTERFRSRAVIQVGAPFRLHATGVDPESVRAATIQLHDEMARLVPDARTDAELRLVCALGAACRGELRPGDAAHILSALHSLDDSDPAASGIVRLRLAEIVQRWDEAAFEPRLWHLAERPGTKRSATIAAARCTAGALLDLPVALVGSIVGAPPFWATQGLYSVVGKRGAGGATVKVLGGALCYTIFGALCYVVGRRRRVSRAGMAVSVWASWVLHAAARPLLSRRGFLARGALAQVRLSRKPMLRASLAADLAEVRSIITDDLGVTLSVSS